MSLAEAPKDSEPICKLKLFSELEGHPAATGFLIQGLLPSGRIIQLNGIHKSGKTTLLAHWLRVMENGGEWCSLQVKKTRVAYISEEEEGEWRDRREELALPPGNLCQCIPFPRKATPSKWEQFISELCVAVEQHDIQLVVIDTLGGLGPVRDEQSNSEVPQYMAPLRQLTLE